MFDYAEKVMELREAAEKSMCGECGLNLAKGSTKKGILFSDAADAIEELLAFAKFVARQAIDTGDNGWVSAEILCRKLNKLGLIETDGEFWTLPLPPKGVE